MVERDIPEIPESDEEFLEEKGYNYRLVGSNADILIIIENFELPKAYTPTSATLLVVLPTGYPNAKVDMFFTRPDVKLANGNWPLNCTGRVTYNNQQWQQWSRHIEWRLGVDNLRSFFAAVKKELAKGI
jgi:hypothetical protein